MIELNNVEDEIIKLTIVGLLDAGYYISVFDGEETTVEFSRDIETITNALKTTDEDYLICYKNPKSGFVDDWVRFVYGNSPWEVICDYNVGLDINRAIVSALKFSDLACEYYQ